MGLIGLPLAVGLLWKKRFALVLVYVMFGLSIFLLAVVLPLGIETFADLGDDNSDFAEAVMLVIWLLSGVYYRKRRNQFH